MLLYIGKLKKDEMTTSTAPTFTDVLYTVVEGFLLAWHESQGEEVTEPDENEVDCLVTGVREAVTDYANGGSQYTYLSRLEGTSTYVMADLSEDELEEYTDLLEGYIAAHDLLDLV